MCFFGLNWRTKLRSCKEQRRRSQHSFVVEVHEVNPM